MTLSEKVQNIIEWFDEHDLPDTTNVLGPVEIGVDLKELRQIAEDLYRLEGLCR